MSRTSSLSFLPDSDIIKSPLFSPLNQVISTNYITVPSFYSVLETAAFYSLGVNIFSFHFTPCSVGNEILILDSLVLPLKQRLQGENVVPAAGWLLTAGASGVGMVCICFI